MKKLYFIIPSKSLIFPITLTHRPYSLTTHSQLSTITNTSPPSCSACGSGQPLAVFFADSRQPTLTSFTFHGMKSTAFSTADLIVTHLQVVPPGHHLDHNTKRPRHKHKVPPKTPLARHGAGQPERPNPPNIRAQPVPNPTGIRARPITNPHVTTFPNYGYAPSKQSFTPFEMILLSMNINMFTIF